MGLLMIIKELQFGVCNNGKPHASLSHKERGEKEVGRVLVNKEFLGGIENSEYSGFLLNCDNRSLAELLPDKRRKSSSFGVPLWL